MSNVTTYHIASAASDTDIRMKMNIEEEIYTALDNRDEKIEKAEHTIKQQQEQLSQKDVQLSQKDVQLSQQQEQLSQQQEQLLRQQEQLAASIRLLRQSGMTVESIAVAMGLTKEDVERLIG